MARLIPKGRIALANDTVTAGLITEDTLTRAVIRDEVGPIVSEVLTDPDVSGVVTDAVGLAVPPAVAGALASAQVPLGIAHNDPEYAIPLGVDSGDYTAGGVLKTGDVQFQRLLHQPASVPFAAFGASVPIESVAYDHEYAIPFYDKDGYIAGGFLYDGSFMSVRGLSITTDMAVSLDTLTKSNIHRVATVGDSLTRGFDNGVDWPLTDAWPAKMAALLPDTTTVFNRGRSGYTVDEISLDVGALQPTVSIPGGTIPASGTFAVTLPAGFGWGYSNARTFTGTLRIGTQKFAGTLNRPTSETTALTFTLATTGTAIAATTATFVSDLNVHAGDVMTVFIGFNDWQNNVQGVEGNIQTHVFNGIKRIVDYLTPQVKRVLIVGTVTASNEPAGNANYIGKVGLNNLLAAAYPGRFWDVRKYLVKQAIYDAGITPTSADLTQMNTNDTLPASILFDTVHIIKPVAAQLGIQFANQLLSRGWA